MPTYEQLYHLNLSNLKATAERWEETVTKFKGLHTSYGDQVVRPFRQANGESALRESVPADIARSGGSEALQDAVGREVDQSHTTGAEWGDQYHG